MGKTLGLRAAFAFAVGATGLAGCATTPPIRTEVSEAITHDAADQNLRCAVTQQTRTFRGDELLETRNEVVGTSPECWDLLVETAQIESVNQTRASQRDAAFGMMVIGFQEANTPEERDRRINDILAFASDADPAISSAMERALGSQGLDVRTVYAASVDNGADADPDNCVPTSQVESVSVQNEDGATSIRRRVVMGCNTTP